MELFLPPYLSRLPYYTSAERRCVLLDTFYNGMAMQNTAWDSLVGHRWAVDLLRGVIAYNRAGHAYLFTGPEHIGKTTLARLFAQALNCVEADPWRRPCGNCRPCNLIVNDRHPDVRLVEPETSGRGRRTLKIEEIRDLQHDLSLAAYETRYKVVVLAHFDAATPAAANAFLKTLEEPPANVILLLTASEADRLLPTIVSRCRVLALRPLAVTELITALHERWGAAPSQAERLAHLADGRPGWAVAALGEPARLQERASHLAALSEALPGRRVERFDLADRLSKNAEELPQLLQTWLSWWRDAALLAWGAPQTNGLVNVDQLETLRPLSRSWERRRIFRALAQTREALWQLEHNANARLVMENLLLSYPQANREESGVQDAR